MACSNRQTSRLRASQRDQAGIQTDEQQKQRKKAEKVEAKQQIPAVKITVKTKQLIEMARLITRHRPTSLRISALLINTIKRAISFRVESNRYYIETQPGKKADHGRHAHMIEVLQEVLSVLAAHVAPATAESDDQAAEEVSNRFKRLEVEDTIDDVAERPIPVHRDRLPQATSATSGVGSEESPAEYIADEICPEADRDIATLYLLQDIAVLQHLVLQLLEKYEKERFPFVAISAGIEYANMLVAQLEQEFRTEFPQPGTILVLQLTAFLMENSRRRSGDIDAAAMAGEQESLQSPYFECRHFAYLTEYTMLRDYLELKSCTGRFPLQGLVPVEDSTAYRPDSNEAKYLEDVAILYDILPFFHFAFDARIEYPWENSLSRDLRLLFKTKTVSLSLLFGIRTIIEAHRHLGSKMEQPFAELTTEARQAKESWLRFYSFRNDNSVNLLPQGARRLIQESLVDQVDTWILQDIIHKVTCDLIKEGESDRARIHSAFYFLRHNPLLCGSMLFGLKTHATTGGFIVAKHTLIPEGVAHLYNAVASEYSKINASTAMATWPAMETFTNAHMSQLFVGEKPPSDSQLYRLSFVSMVGVSVTAWTSNCRSNSAYRSARGFRQLQDPVPFASKLLDCMEEEKTITRLSNVSDSLNELYEAYRIENGENSMLTTHIDPRDKTHSARSALRLKPHELVLAAVMKVTEESKAMKLDYFTLLSDCWTLLSKLTAVPDVDDLLTQRIRREEDEKRLLIVVYAILEEAAEHDKIKRLAGAWKSGDATTSELMRQVAEWVEVWLMVRARREEQTTGAESERSESSGGP